MSDENVALTYRWFEEVWNKGRAEAIDEMFAADGIAHGLGEAGVDVEGPHRRRPNHRGMEQLGHLRADAADRRDAACCNFA